MGFDLYATGHDQELVLVESGGEVVRMLVDHPEDVLPGDAAYAVDACTVTTGVRAASGVRIGTFGYDAGIVEIEPDGTVVSWRNVRLIERGRVFVQGPKANTVDGWSRHW